MGDIRLCSSTDELRAAVTPIWHYFFRQPVDEQVQTLQRVMPVHRVHSAWEDGGIVGAAGSFPFDLTVPLGRI